MKLDLVHMNFARIKPCPACQHPITPISFCGQCPNCLAVLELPKTYTMGVQCLIFGVMLLVWMFQNPYLAGLLLVMVLVLRLETTILAYLVPRYELKAPSDAKKSRR